MNVESASEFVSAAATATTAPPGLAETGAAAARRPPRLVPPATRREEVGEVVLAPRHPIELDTVALQWQLALDAAQRALSAAGGSLPAAELARRRRDLARERQETAASLRRLADTERVRPVPWLSPVPVTPTMLGLPATAKACVFDLDGVLTDTDALHASAWGEVFDAFLQRLAEKTGWHAMPFDRDADYTTYFDGRPRLEGIHLFLASRGIRLPEGLPGDPPAADTACGLARRKGEVLARRIRSGGVTARPGARRYVEAAGHAGLARAVISASASTLPMLELAGLASLVQARIDADLIRAEGLRSRPAPDVLLTACAHLGVDPEEAVTFTHSPAGVAAGNAARLTVVGVGAGEEGEQLRGFGAERVIASLSSLLDRQLADVG